MSNEKEKKKVGIVVSGGPAPGINGVIHSATIEAANHGHETFGIYDGFKHLMQSKLVGQKLTIEDVSRIHLDGGSILRTARANPTETTQSLKHCAKTLSEANIGYLLAIGGDDTAYAAYSVTRYAQEQMGLDLKTVHVPKTIDNDLPLPEEINTFGYETARELGTQLVMNLMEEALTGQRWFLGVTMGRKAGHLALGIGKSSGATITLIPEEWGGHQIRFQEVIDILVTTVIRRLVDDKPYGVAIISEGVMEKMAREDLKALEYVERDAYGHIRLSNINFSHILTRVVRAELMELGLDVRVTGKDLGYELRCADPIAFDIDYTRSLGEAAVEYLLSGGTNVTITLQGGRVVPIPFDEMIDPRTGRTEVRMVKLDSFTYRSAYKFMIRLKPGEVENEELLVQMAAQTHLSPEEFKKRYGYLVDAAPRPF